ncbi:MULTISPECIES: hypothetical protein [Vibrio harveyi group]|uniref:hypothetical protein n=1 Tax=Vibrio harveyi group TaxID=717610 RepID=UPI0001543214|nr:hypothetical protein A1Q_3784 [Vibrio campbellii HY01]MDF4740179.1 hypothetical protein [Vibrio parahaemolyticus]HDM8209945.1 hypothetical protein [Vibrio campbellii]
MKKKNICLKSEINAAARGALDGGILDHVIYDSEIISAFGSSNKPSIQRDLDVPIKSLVALGPREFFEFGSSWREAVKGLHCDGWDDYYDEIVDYFTSALKDKSFPAPKSSQELRIGFTGGAIYCKLGNHRAVAAKAWLAYHQGEDAIFKLARCFYRPVKPVLRELMERCLTDGDKLKFFYYDPPKNSRQDVFPKTENIYYLVLVEKGSSESELYILDGEKLVMITPKTGFFAAFSKGDLYSKCRKLRFKDVPPPLMEMMLNDGEVRERFGVSVDD